MCECVVSLLFLWNTHVIYSYSIGKSFPKNSVQEADFLLPLVSIYALGAEKCATYLVPQTVAIMPQYFRRESEPVRPRYAISCATTGCSSNQTNLVGYLVNKCFVKECFSKFRWCLVAPIIIKEF